MVIIYLLAIIYQPQPLLYKSHKIGNLRLITSLLTYGHMGPKLQVVGEPATNKIILRAAERRLSSFWPPTKAYISLSIHIVNGLLLDIIQCIPRSFPVPKTHLRVHQNKRAFDIFHYETVSRYRVPAETLPTSAVACDL